MHMPGTTERVTRNTSLADNERIEEQTERNITYYASHPDEIDARLKELDREWDIERTLETQASALTVIGLAMSVFVSRRWLALPALVGGFMFQHATQGWCPPLPTLRRVGIRTQTEIERERFALRALRGDFINLPRLEDQPEEHKEERISKRILEIVKG